MDRALGGPARLDGHLKRRDDELGAHVRRHRPAHDPAAEEVLHRRQIQPALTGLDLLDVRGPDPVRSVGAELAADKLAEGLNALHRGRAALAPTPVSSLQARQRHFVRFTRDDRIQAKRKRRHQLGGP
jgi:hypothetical protein